MILVLRPYAVSARTQGQNSKGGMSLHGESMHDKNGVNIGGLVEYRTVDYLKGERHDKRKKTSNQTSP